MTVIKTTTKKFKQGVQVTGSKFEIHWESTGHLSVHLFDASGAVPLADRKITVDIPDEGVVDLVTDADGKLFYPDVPFQDYELKLEDGITVHAPAVANRDDVQERHVTGIAFGFASLLVCDAGGVRLAQLALTLTGPDGVSLDLETDSDGLAEHVEPVPAGEYRLQSELGSATFVLPDFAAGLTIVPLAAEAP